jgi:hypothetical protein
VHVGTLLSHLSFGWLPSRSLAAMPYSPFVLYKRARYRPHHSDAAGMASTRLICPPVAPPQHQPPPYTAQHAPAHCLYQISVRCSFVNRVWHSRMPLDPTRACLKLAHVRLDTIHLICPLILLLFVIDSIHKLKAFHRWKCCWCGARFSSGSCTRRVTDDVFGSHA